jgi:tetratricopeptide (TPR) repeat protein
MRRSTLLACAAATLTAFYLCPVDAPILGWQIIRPAQAEQLDPMVVEGRRINALYNSGHYDDVLAQAPPLLEKIKARAGENNQLYYIVTLMMARSYQNLGRFADAELLFKRDLEIQEQRFGPNSFQAEVAINELASIERYLAHYTESQSLYQRALDLLAKFGGAGTQDQGRVMSSLARVYQDLGRYGDAESMFKQALGIFEKVLSSYFPNPAKRRNDRAIMFIGDVAMSLTDLAELYIDLGRQTEAEPLLRRAIDMRESAQKVDSLELAGSLVSLGRVYSNLDRAQEAEPLLKRALGIAETNLPPSSPVYADIFDGLTKVYRDLGRYAEAETAAKRSAAVYENSIGSGNPLLATALNNLASVYLQMQRYADAEPLVRRALEIDEKALGADHRNVSLVLNNLASLKLATGQTTEALGLSRRSTQVAIALLSKDAGSGAGFDVRSLRPAFEIDLQALHAAGSAGVADASFAAEAFAMAQWANQSTAAAALTQMAARFSTGSDALAALVREQQDATTEYRGLDKSLVEEVSKPSKEHSAAREQDLRGRMNDLDQRLQKLNQRLSAQFPDFAALTSPQPVAASDAQKLLTDDEALVFLLSGEKATQVFAVTRAGLVWQTVALGADDVAKKVTAFRRGLDVDEYENSLANGKPVLFDLGAAHDLYAALLKPVEGAIKDKKRLIIVPTGALTALPFHLLVTKAPDTTAGAPTMDAYRNAAWLLKRHAICVLPSVASLQALRSLARKEEAIRRPGVQCRCGGGRCCAGSTGQDRRGADARAQRLSAGRGSRSQQARASLAAARRHGRRIARRGTKARRAAKRHSYACGCNRNQRQAPAACRLAGDLFRHPWPRCR